MSDLYPTNCEVCGASLKGDAGRCTNGRCSNCHRKYCTPGGETSPGHGRGTVAMSVGGSRIETFEHDGFLFVVHRDKDGKFVELEAAALTLQTKAGSTNSRLRREATAAFIRSGK